MMGRRVAVTGIGIVSPLGNDWRAFGDALERGRSGVGRLKVPAPGRSIEPAVRHPKSHVGAAASFEPGNRFPAPQMRMLDRVSQFALAASADAVAEAAIDFARTNRRRVGVFVGTGGGGTQTTDEGYFTLYGEKSDRVKPYSVLMAMTNAAASWIGLEYGIEGPNLTFSTACSSSAVAIGEAARRIAGGEVDVAIAGGCETPLNFGTLIAWDALRTLAPEDPEDAAASCKPFDRSRSGLVLGEGAAMIVMEDWAHADARGTSVLAELVGYGLSTDAGHLTRPTVDGQASAMRSALESACLRPQDIGYINAHGTGTLANDAVETAAIKSVFFGHAGLVPVSSTKSMHGHLMGAAGALELVATIFALHRQVVPPTMHLKIPDPACDLDYVPNEARAVPGLGIAMSNSFAFGGTNAVLICRSPRV